MRTTTSLIPLDGSEMAEAAITEARQLARPDSSKLVLVRAANAFTLPGNDAIGAQLYALQDAESYVDAVRAGRETAAPAPAAAATSTSRTGATR